MRQDIETWRGKVYTNEEIDKFELRNILNQWGMLSVIETQNNGNTYTNIATINPVPAAIKKNGLPEGFNPAKVFDIDKPDWELWDLFSDKLKEKIKKSPEWQAQHGDAEGSGPEDISKQAGNFDDMENDLPF